MSTRTLINTRDFPPGGYRFRQPELSWENPSPLQGLEESARLLQMVRAQNPTSGLNPSLDACIEDIKAYTAKRLDYDPKWCGAAPVAVDSKGNPTGGKPRRCKSCGR